MHAFELMLPAGFGHCLPAACRHLPLFVAGDKSMQVEN
jgi:hypothetical protein